MFHVELRQAACRCEMLGRLRASAPACSTWNIAGDDLAACLERRAQGEGRRLSSRSQGFAGWSCPPCDHHHPELAQAADVPRGTSRGTYLTVGSRGAKMTPVRETSTLFA